ncbi:MAG: hypothetical protein ACLTMP_05640 [Eggerthella lenta]
MDDKRERRRQADEPIERVGWQMSPPAHRRFPGGMRGVGIAQALMGDSRLSWWTSPWPGSTRRSACDSARPSPRWEPTAR